MEERAAARIAEHMAQVELELNGYARQALWECEDGWVVGYTTERITGGKLDGKFAALAYKPYGAKESGNVERVYMRGFSQRKMAKARAITMFGQHSPKWKAKHR
jgi:hypothetical protein